MSGGRRRLFMKPLEQNSWSLAEQVSTISLSKRPENKLTNALRTHRWSYKRCLQLDGFFQAFLPLSGIALSLSLRTTWAINAWEERNGVAFTADERGQHEWIHQWRAVTFIFESCELLGLLQRQREAEFDCFEKWWVALVWFVMIRLYVLRWQCGNAKLNSGWLFLFLTSFSGLQTGL